jgi:hypothetical protein
MTTTQEIDTGTVTGRRELHFDNLDQLQTEVDKLTAADQGGKLQRIGNWTLAQALGHIASWINFAFDGYPMKVPFFIKLIIRPMKNRFINGPMPSGKKLPGVPNGTFGAESLPLDEAQKRMSAAIARLKASSPSEPNPIFGPLTHDQWTSMNLRHAELHLSFFKPV